MTFHTRAPLALSAASSALLIAKMWLWNSFAAHPYSSSGGLSDKHIPESSRESVCPERLWFVCTPSLDSEALGARGSLSILRCSGEQRSERKIGGEEGRKNEEREKERHSLAVNGSDLGGSRKSICRKCTIFTVG